MYQSILKQIVTDAQTETELGGMLARSNQYSSQQQLQQTSTITIIYTTIVGVFINTATTN